MDERTFYATVAERAGLSKEEAADLTRATLEAITDQISGGEVERLAPALPDWLDRHLPRHRGPRHHDAARPVPAAEFIRQLAERTGLTEDEVRRGVSAVLTTVREAVDPAHLDHALSLLPKDYRQLTAARAAGRRGGPV